VLNSDTPAATSQLLEQCALLAIAATRRRDPRGEVRLIVAAASAALAAALVVVDAAPATFPGRNGDIAYADLWGSDVEINTDLYRVCPDGSHERRLLPRHADLGDVTLFAERAIAITRGEPFEPSARVAVIPARGGALRELAAGRDPDWSPDGKHLLFATSTPSGATALAVMSADGSGQRVLALGTPAGWAPNGRDVAFATPEGHAAVVAPSGGPVRRLARRAGVPLFSPDGKWLAFSRGSDLYITRVDGTRTQYVPRRPRSKT
jgi:WD40-like Beta Propeller Repeat